MHMTLTGILLILEKSVETSSQQSGITWSVCHSSCLLTVLVPMFEFAAIGGLDFIYLCFDSCAHKPGGRRYEEGSMPWHDCHCSVTGPAAWDVLEGALPCSSSVHAKAHAMLCYVMLYQAALCHAMLCYAMLCYAMLYYTVLGCAFCAMLGSYQHPYW